MLSKRYVILESSSDVKHYNFYDIKETKHPAENVPHERMENGYYHYLAWRGVYCVSHQGYLDYNQALKERCENIGEKFSPSSKHILKTQN